MQKIDRNQIHFDKEATPDGDSVKIRYFENHQPLKAYNLNSMLGKQCAGLQLIIKDLEIVGATLKLALTLTEKNNTSTTETFKTFNPEDAEQLILASLVTSSIVTYAKYFTQGKGLAPFIQRDQVRKVLDSDLLAYHDKMLDLRHTWVAHGGENDLEIAKTVVVVDMDRKKSFDYFHHVHFSTAPIVNDIEKFINLTNNVLALIRDILQKRSLTLWTEELSTLAVEEHDRRASDYVLFSNRK